MISFIIVYWLLTQNSVWHKNLLFCSSLSYIKAALNIYICMASLKNLNFNVSIKYGFLVTCKPPTSSNQLQASHISQASGQAKGLNDNNLCTKHTTGMQSMTLLGDLGACPPENFEKINALRLILAAIW